jgi:hypothetical protein
MKKEMLQRIEGMDLLERSSFGLVISQEKTTKGCLMKSCKWDA